MLTPLKNRLFKVGKRPQRHETSEPRPSRSAAAHQSQRYFDNLVFAGGGNRCFWQAGFWSTVAPVLERSPTGVAAVSAGSAVACTLFAGTFEHGFTHYKQAITQNSRNLYMRNLLKSQPVFPHGLIYRDAILRSIDAPALARLHQGPDITILASRAPQWASSPMAMLLGAIGAGVDVMNRQSVAAAASRRLGFKPLCVSVRECGTPEALADLIIASSCIPPLTPTARRDGAMLLDGGLVSNVPIEFGNTKAGATLVLLTRRFTKLPSVPGYTYVQPSRPIPVGAWDYTNQAALQATFELGKHDGATFCRALNHPPFTSTQQRTL